MKILNDYIAYRKELPNYAPWKNQQKQKEAKKLEYIKITGIDEASKQSDIKRAKAVLEAIDVMDEYSQTRAEDTENMMNVIKSSITQPVVHGAMYLSGILFTLIGVIKKLPAQKIVALSTIGTALTSSIVDVLTVSYLSIVSARKETEASRKGRLEAMKNDLANPAHFAELTEEQEKQVEEIAKNIKIDKKEAKKIVKGSKTEMKGFASAIKELGKKDETFLKEREEFFKNIEGNKKKYDNVELSKEEIEEAKKDQQLIQNVVEKIDIASQSYAEDVELATDLLSAVSGGIAMLTGLSLYAISSKLFKNNSTPAKILSFGIAIAMSIPVGLYATKIQKQASRVARWKVKQDFLNNPEKIYYVDEEKIKNTKIKPDNLNKEEKIGFFERIKKICRENKEYNAYLKEQNVADKQRTKALDKIKLTPEQEKRAKQLQANVFKMFNNLDEKSQTYSESTEALSEIVSCGLSTILLTMVEIFTMLACFDLKKGPKESTPVKVVLTLIPAILINIYATKEQKRASKVADMLAIKEMNDYKNFLDYSTDSFENSKQTKTNPLKSSLSPMLQKALGL